MIIPIDLGEKSYDIILERGAIKKADTLLGIPADRKVLIVTDSGVPTEYVKAGSMQGTERSDFFLYRNVSCRKI